jgi:SAM-dependent methyltransferase
MEQQVLYDRWAATYEEFEGSVASDTWDHGIVREVVALGLSAPRMLDLGAGTGVGRERLLAAIPNASVVSLDRSAEMLDAGRIPEAERVVADMADFRLEPDSFDVAVCGFDAFNYLDAAGVDACLRSLAECLGPGGYFIFDYSSRKMLKYDWGNLQSVTRAAGRVLHRDHRWDPVLNLSRTELVLKDARGRRVWREVHVQYALDPSDIYELAHRHGFEIERVRNINGETYSPSAPMHVYVLRR